MKLKKCRNCHCRKLSKLFSLGKLSFTGKFPKNIKTNIKKTELTLVICEKCSLVQLNNNYNLKYEIRRFSFSTVGISKKVVRSRIFDDF